MNPNALTYAHAHNTIRNPLSEALNRLSKCQITSKDQKLITPILTKWFSPTTLNNILKKWDKHHKGNRKLNKENFKPLTFVLYNMQGFNSRALDVVELIHRVDASFVICTEVGNRWRTQRIPDFHIFYEKGTNKNGGVIIGVGKHLKASKVGTNIPNTFVVDIFGLNEPL